jgi:two-component system chemotaxis sensor kinase CheA
MEELDDVISEFLVESHENLDALDQSLVALEQDPDPAEIGRIFRTIHTIKGTSGFLGFATLERVTHVGENLLSKLRDQELPVTTETTSALLAMVDAVRVVLGQVEATGAEGELEVDDLIAWLERLKNGESGAPAPAEAPASAAAADAAPAAADVPRVGELLVAAGAANVSDVAEAFTHQAAGDERPLGEVLVEVAEVDPAAVADALRTQDVLGGAATPAPAAAPAAARADAPAATAETIRVDVDQLDVLIDLVGELVLARNQLVQMITETGKNDLLAGSQRLSLITSELQEAALRTRMQPIGNVFHKFGRVVRDVSVGLGKDVRLELEGEDTELDKSILEAIKDPLTHLVRNAVDHGIEGPDARAAAGKSTQGRLLVRAFHEGGQVNIEIADDGAGIDVDRVRAKAIEKGLLTADAAEKLSERELLGLIFLPGFSTAAVVTNISGRGVGMDVVRTNIERIGGTVDVHSTPGAGTSFRIKIPLTLAIVPALVIGAGGGRFCIPQVSLLELVRLEAADVASGVEWIQGTPVHRLRGRLLPLVDLSAELGGEPWLGNSGEGPVNIVVLQADNRQFGLVVERISDSVEIVVKALGQHLKAIPLFAGATIMGDGRVGLILDVVGLAQRAGVVGESRERTVAAIDGRGEGSDSTTDAVLVLRTPDDGRLGLPLAEVDRLEEFPLTALESASGRSVVQYRDQILPLVELGGSTHRPDGEDTIQVIVHRNGEHLVGFVVDRILDIVHERLELQPSERHGVLGTAVVSGRVTDVVDVDAVVAAAGLLTSEVYS